MNSPKHMRQRCRATRCVPKTPPRTSMRTSPAAASRTTEPRKMIIPTGTPGLGAIDPLTILKPSVTMGTPTAKPNRRAPQSKMVVSPSRLLAVSQPVVTRYNAEAPPKTLPSKAAVEPIVSMEMKNMFPAVRCRGEPLRNATAATPDSNPTTPPQM